jgi:hypothetical protein
MMRLVAASLSLLLSSCLLRATLKPQRGEMRVVLWNGADLSGAGGADVALPARTPVQVVESANGTCRVSVSGRVALEGEVDCVHLGNLTRRPTQLRVDPEGPVRLELNGGILVAPRERRGDWVRVAGDALGTFEGWVLARELGTSVDKAWLAPGLPRYPWICEDGSWMYDKPGGTFLLWIPGPWCRVTLLEEREGWAKVEYLDTQIRVVGWVERESLAPDREPRFHPGARTMRVKARSQVYGSPRATKAFGQLEAGVRVWASLTSRGRMLVQTQSTPVEVVGWVEASALEP